MLNVATLMEQHLPQLQRHRWLQKPTHWLLRHLLCEQAIGEFATRYPQLQGFEFVEQVLDFFQFSYRVNDRELEHIPSQGRVIIVANHPIGSLDGLALLKLVHERRQDVKVVANDLLMQLAPLQSLLIPVSVFSSKLQRQAWQSMQQQLDEEGALIVFPAGEVSRLAAHGIRDGRWQAGFVKLAQRCQAPLLPICLQAKNSAWFYGASLLYRPLGTWLLVQEMFKQQHREMTVRIGAQIPALALQQAQQQADASQVAALVRKHVYRLGKNRPGLFHTQAAVAPPEPRQALLAALAQCELLGQSSDGHCFYRYQYNGNSALLREIGRLREIAFRAVGEGTGKRRDLDDYDRHYQHLILWHPQQLEIVGAYRLGDAAERFAAEGIAGLYTDQLFAYQKSMLPYIQQGLELGRSFVQPRYWGKRALDYLWQGIGLWLQQRPQYRYLFGAVTLSAALPTEVKDALVQFFSQQFADPEGLALPRHPYQPTSQPLPPPSGDYSADFAQLKQFVMTHQANVPTLYKQYADLCEPGGVRFCGFSVDADFAYAIDGLVLVDLQALKSSKRQRYLAAGH